MATRTYYETPGAVAELNGSDILVVQQGTGTAATGGFAEMKKTTLEEMKGFMVGEIDEEVSQLTSALTDLENDTYRKAEVDEKVAEATPSDYASLKNKVTNLEYENRIVSAVIKKKIAEETTMEGNVIDFPTVDGYPLAEYGELRSVEGKSLVWNQLATPCVGSGIGAISWNATGDGSVTITLNNPTSDVQLTWSSVALISGHRYYVIGGDKGKGFEIYFSGHSATSGDYVVTANRSGSTNLYLYIYKSVPNGTYKLDIRVVDVTSIGEDNLAWVKAYALAHPSYDAGSLVSAVYEEGVSRGYSDSETEEIEEGKLLYGFKVINASLTTNTRVYLEGIEAQFTFRYDGSLYLSSSSKSQLNAKGIKVYLNGVEFTRSDNYRLSAGDVVRLSEGVKVSSLDAVLPSNIVATQFESLLDLSFLNNVEDIGIEGTLIDFEREEVTWSHKRLKMKSLQYDYNATYGLFFSTLASSSVFDDCLMKAFGSSGAICSAYATNSSAYISAVDNMSIDFSSGWLGGGKKGILIKDSRYSTVADFVANLPSDAEVVYELATPITRSFSDLGITIPSSWDGGKPWIRVEAGGSFHIESGTPAEATVSFLTNLGGN